MEDLLTLKTELGGKEAFAVVSKVVSLYGNEAALSTSFSIEDQVITDMLSRITSHPHVFTLDTGRLPEATYKVLERTREHYNIEIRIYFPKYHSVEELVNTYGPNFFYQSVEKRKLCCNVRKLEPLARALTGVKVWITGLRREQSVTRQTIELVEYDAVHRIIKVNPLYNWTEEEVWKYIRTHNVPYNSLYDKGYRSIGCEPCTRPVQAGEDIRAGRWWWEHPETKECGLHLNTKEE